MRSAPIRTRSPHVMPRIAPDCALALFAKAPEPGKVKTRLVPALGAVGAAELHRRLVLHTLDMAAGASPFVHLYCAPDTDHPFFSACGRRGGIHLHTQHGEDLGARMERACEALLQENHAVILIGTDAPALTVRHLVGASEALAGGADATFVPADDGGYALIGLTRCLGDLFDDMPWGSERVMSATRARLQRLGCRWTELEPVWDVDRPDDYERLSKEGWLDALPQ